MYIRVRNGVAENYSIGQLRKDNPNTSFPKNISNAVLADWGVFPMKATPIPAIDYTKNIAEGAPTQQGGEWVQTWVVTNATAQEIQTRTNDQANAVRSDRNQKLADCDWTQIADAPVDKSAWGTYRQALRDISGQAGFPWTITWPSKPE